MRYRAGNARAQHVGVLVLEELAKVAARVGASPSCDREHATVLILDRADDTLTPLLHEYTGTRRARLRRVVIFVESWSLTNVSLSMGFARTIW